MPEIRTIPPTLTKTEWNALLDHSLIKDASYIVYSGSGLYWTLNGSTGKIDYSGSDASAVIQAAINVLPLGGKIFIKNSGAPYVCNVALTDGPNHYPFELESDGAILQKATGVGMEYLTVKWLFDIGNVAVATTKYPIKMNGIRFTVGEGNNPAAPAGIICLSLSAGVGLATYPYLKVENCSFYDTYGSIQLINTDFTRIIDCDFNNVSIALGCIGATPKRHIQFSRNRIYSTDTGVFLASGDPIEDVHITDNYMRGGFALVDMNCQGTVRKIWIQNNTHYPIGDGVNSFHPIFIVQGTDATIMSDIRIEDNLFDGNEGLVGTAGAIEIYSRTTLTNLMDKLVIRRNTIKNMSLTGSRTMYIEALKFAVGGVTIKDNDVSDNNNINITLVNPERVVINTNRGYVTESSGTTTILSQSGSLAHGLDSTPNIVNITASGSSSSMYMGGFGWYLSSSTGIWVVQTGSGTVGFNWKAEV